MTTWNHDDLDRGAAEELDLASRRADGTLRPYVTMWVARVGEELYVRSAYGSKNPWYRRAIASGEGRIRARGVERDVSFADAAAQVHPELDAEYHRKYDRHGAAIVGTVVGDAVRDVTIRLVPATD
ncbi:DUF2255 family protein [Agromyces subbeticus]|uniref:DUF2255 family protein n=1 Tax=Agromyces subbeticus TaxID=293890 RepID=UPI0003B348EE|nr:DUF2255 family protein [Agromyces subbeticus]